MTEKAKSKSTESNPPEFSAINNNKSLKEIVNNVSKLSELTSLSYAPLGGINMESFSAVGQTIERLLESISPKLNNGSYLKLENEIKVLNEKAQSQAHELRNSHDDISKLGVEIKKLTGINDELNSKLKIQHLINSISDKAHEKIANDSSFQGQFGSDAEVNSFVVSIDIRRSTELMLKARSPKLFANFITTLCHELVNMLKNNWAVVDKFTGDGLLAFFPSFYSGDDAGYFALKSANEANKVFEDVYKKFRNSFSVILNDIGLGIGIDYGKVSLIQMGGTLTIVGQPVVYACRMGAAPAGRILLNQSAYEIVIEKYENYIISKEVSIDIKNEGSLLAYDLQLTDKTFLPSNPKWLDSYTGSSS